MDNSKTPPKTNPYLNDYYDVTEINFSEQTQFLEITNKVKTINKEELLSFNFHESILLDNIKDVNDSIKDYLSIESEFYNKYYSEAKIKGIFNGKKYDEDSTKLKDNSCEFLLKVPSKIHLLNENSFNISFRFLKNKFFVSENLLVKIISDNFIFSESMFQLKETDTNITLTKTKPNCNYEIKLKIYYENELAQEKNLNLLERKYV